MPKIRCYNCGLGLDKGNETREHIPAKNLFEGYDEKYKVNRITVPACSYCNGRYSPTDEEFRNMIGIIAKNIANKKITEKSVRSILRKDPLGQRLASDIYGKISGVKFNEVPIEDYHKKNFKGLFYHKYGSFLSSEYKLYVNIDENDWSHPVMAIISYLKELFEAQFSGHPNILKYTIQPFRLKIENPEKKDLVPYYNEYMYVGLLEYNNEHAALMMAISRKWLEELKNQNQ